MKYFKNVKSFENLKAQYKTLLKKNHPDNGGDVEEMKNINVEFDALFPIWKDRKEVETGEKVKETSAEMRRHFYTEFGWEGSRYSGDMTTTEIAKAIRMYCKEKYPTWKFSVTSKYFSGGSSIDVSVMEAPEQIFDLEACRKAYAEHLENEKAGYYGGRGLGMDIEKMLESGKMHWQIYKINDTYKSYFTEYGFAVLDDVYNFMQSYRYDDSDGMIDYFSTNFYGSFNIGKWNKGFKIVPKTARIKNKDTAPRAKAKKADPQQKKKEPEKLQGGYTYKITKGEDTRDGSELWIVRIVESLDRTAYLAELAAMKERGGYYSRFRKGFIFRVNPAEILKTA